MAFLCSLQKKKNVSKILVFLLFMTSPELFLYLIIFADIVYLIEYVTVVSSMYYVVNYVIDIAIDDVIHQALSSSHIMPHL